MPQDPLDKRVARNSQRIRRREAEAIQSPDSGRREISFSGIDFEISVSIEVYKRDINDTLIIGHPDGDENGVGNGEVGPQHGAWTLAVSSTDSAEWTRDGRTVIRDALAGGNAGIAEAGIGTGSSAAIESDTDLGSLVTKRTAWGQDDAANITRGSSIFLTTDHTGSATEFGLYDSAGNLLARLTTSDVSPTQDEELRVGIIAEVTGDAIGSGVVTDDGEAVVAESFRHTYTTTGIDTLAVGTGTSDFSASSTALTSQEVEKTTAREKLVEAIRTKTLIFPTDPASTLPVDLSEIGVKSTNGRLIWAATFDPVTIDTDYGEVHAGATFQFV